MPYVMLVMVLRELTAHEKKIFFYEITLHLVHFIYVLNKGYEKLVQCTCNYLHQ